MKCWICETNEANSKEHNIKKSDLKNLYPHVSQKAPVYKKSNGTKPQSIGGLNSNNFKYQKFICEDCNNSKTQPHDKSWETLSNYLFNNWNKISDQNGFNVNTVFPINTEKEMINVQSFLIKMLGCSIKQSSDTSFDIKNLSKNLLRNTEHQSVYFSFRSSEKSPNENYSANSDVEMFTDKNPDILYLHWFYILGPFAVDVIYTESSASFDLNGAQRPSQIGEFMNLSKLNYEQDYSIC